MSTAAGAGHAPHALSPRQQTAVTNLQRHWRGLARRLHVLRKWSSAVSNRLENQEEQRMVELGMFVESIAGELSMDQGGAPSLSNTVEHKSEPHEHKCDDPAPFLPPALCCPPLRCGESHARTDPPTLRPPADPPPFVPRPFSLHFPLYEADVLELVASFSRGQRLSRGSVEQLLDRHLELLQPLPNASVASCKALRPEHRTAAARPHPMRPHPMRPHPMRPHPMRAHPMRAHPMRPGTAAMRGRAPPWAAVGLLQRA